MINSFNPKTPETVKKVLNSLNASRTRVRLFYGDTITGMAWAEENFVLGTIGNSTGIAKIPLLIANTRSMSGGAILDGSLVGIVTTGGRWLYKHPSFSSGLWSVKGCEVFNNGVLHATFKTEKQVNNYMGFMTGARFAK